MKKLLVLLTALTMAFSLIACTSKPADDPAIAQNGTAFVVVTGNGLSIGMPADIKYVDTDEATGIMVFASDDNNAAITFTTKIEDAVTPADITEEVLLASLSAGGRLSDVTLENSGAVEQTAGPAVIGFGKGTTESGKAMETAIEYFFPADGSGYYVITYLYAADTANSLTDNIEIVMSSVKTEN